MEAATQTNGGDRFVGRPMKRREDPRFITGTGAYVDDLHILGTVHAAIVRSTEAHAAITSIDTSEAAAQPGILGAFTAEGELIGLRFHNVANMWAYIRPP